MHVTPFDASEFLDSEDAVAEYLAAALADPDPDLFVAALGDVARARGMTRIAREAGLGRESLYKAPTPGSRLRYETIRRVMDVLGVKLTVATPGWALLRIDAPDPRLGKEIGRCAKATASGASGMRSRTRPPGPRPCACGRSA